MLAIAFALVFFGMRRSYPNLRGMMSVGSSFLLFVLGISLAVAATPINWFVSGAAAIVCIFTSFVVLYRGIMRFIGSRKSSFAPIVFSSIALAVLYFFSHVQDKAGPRIVAISLTIGAIRTLIAIEVLHKSSTSPSPAIMRLFASCMLLFSAISISGACVCAFHAGDHFTARQSSSIASAALLLSVVSIFITGLFILLLSSGELIAASRDESQKDSLSGAFNRRGIEAKLAAELARVRSAKSKLSIALIDVDYFKSINDIQGHAAGDAALRHVAGAISTHLRGRDYLGRYGGDEFLLILPQTPCSIAVGVTERLCQAVNGIVAAGGSIPLTLSIGLTEAVPEDDAVTLIARADKALYQAKSDGRNCRRVVMANVGDPADPPSVHSTTPLGDLLLPTTESSAIN